MIALVGGGSSLAAEGVNRLKESSPVLIFARHEPTELTENPSVSWVPTAYDAGDGSLDLLADLPISSVVWLASPFPRGLYLNQSRTEISNAVKNGTEYQLLFVQQVLRTMVRQRYGRFLFVGSHLATLGDEGSLLYMVVKASQKALSRAVALEYGRLGVTSNVIELGPLTGGYASGLPPERVQEYIQRSARRSFVSHTEFWDLAMCLLGSTGVNGTEVVCDGGFR